MQWEVKKLFGNILTQKVSARTLTVSGECNFGWRIVHNCKTNNNDDIYIKQQNQTKKTQKTVTTHFFVAIEQDLETQVTNTLKNQVISKMKKYPLSP